MRQRESADGGATAGPLLAAGGPAVLCCLLLLALLWSPPGLSQSSIAFIYAGDLLPHELTAFDRAVIQPQALSPSRIRRVRDAGTRLYAYLSVGEQSSEAFRDNNGLAEAVIGRNPDWNTRILSTVLPAYRNYLLERTADFMAMGYDGLFLDTLDSYQAALRDDEGRRLETDALVSLLREMHETHGARLILNRGFELLASLPTQVEAVAGESLLRGYRVAEDRYVPVSEPDHAWLLARFREVQGQGVEAIAIDYLPPQQRTRRLALAREIRELGITPWVTDGRLRGMGVGDLEPVPRTLLLFHNSAQVAMDFSEVHRHLAMVVEYLGYRPRYVDMAGGGWPDPDPTRVAGAVFWGSGEDLQIPRTRRWLERALGRVPVSLLGGMPDDSALLGTLGLAPREPPAPPLKGRTTSGLFGFEVPFRVHPASTTAVALEGAGCGPTGLIKLRDSGNRDYHPAALCGWGGFVGDPYVTRATASDQPAWLLDPFAWLQRSLRLQPLPAPDVSTESGRRILTSHIDGDGFVSRALMPGTPLAGEVVWRKVIRDYELPFTVSIIEGEISPEGVYPQHAEEAQEIARLIFAEPNVEVASHTFSHPYYWSVVTGESEDHVGEAAYGFHLDIPGYRFDLQRDVRGSVEYINRQLTAPHRPVTVFLWSGDARPTEEALELTEELGLWNVNGANTRLLADEPWQTQVWPVIRPVGDFYQVYAPIMNENVYTNLWTGPYWGFRRVLETFELTGRPRRLKPMSVYYHMYSGVYPASLDALDRIYRHSMALPHTSLYLSEYAARADSLYDVGLARDLQGGWHIRPRAVRTLRLPEALGSPLLDGGTGLAGAARGPDGMYLHLVGRSAAFSTSADGGGDSSLVWLESCNCMVDQWRRAPDGSVALQLRGYESIEFRVTSTAPCTLRAGDILHQSRADAGGQIFELPVRATGPALLRCGA